MKVLHRLFIYTDTIDKASRDRAAAFLSIPGVLKVQNSYRRDPNILDHLELESDDDIDEASLRRYVAEPGYHNIHLVLNETQWGELGLRPTLYGQCRVVGGQIITYGAWGERRTILNKYPAQIREVFTEETLGEWHEPDHGLRRIFNIKKPTTHAVFYGYRLSDSDQKTARRWVRKPYPLDAWRELPWHLLPDQTPKRVGLVQQLADVRFSVLGMAHEILTGLADRIAARNGLQPLVYRRANAVVEAMALLGHPVRIVEGYRSPERQAELYAQGRTTPGNIVTNAKPGNSFHQYGVAVDFVFRNEGYNASEELWQTLGTIGKAHGFDWGGDWKRSDRPHFSITLGYTLRDFKQDKVDYSKFH